MGNDFHVDESVQRNLESFTCKLYGEKDLTLVNEARYSLFRKGKFSDTALPPNKDCLSKHVLRANYQAAIWKKGTTAVINAPPVTNHGWNISQDGKIGVVWMENKCAPDELLKDCNCKCKKGCATLRCSCKKANNKCNDMCQCVGCSNKSDEDDYHYDVDNDSGSDMEEDF